LKASNDTMITNIAFCYLRNKLFVCLTNEDTEIHARVSFSVTLDEWTKYMNNSSVPHTFSGVSIHTYITGMEIQTLSPFAISSFMISGKYTYPVIAKISEAIKCYEKEPIHVLIDADGKSLVTPVGGRLCVFNYRPKRGIYDWEVKIGSDVIIDGRAITCKNNIEIISGIISTLMLGGDPDLVAQTFSNR
jgi:hypothetical protein